MAYRVTTRRRGKRQARNRAFFCFAESEQVREFSIYFLSVFIVGFPRIITRTLLCCAWGEAATRQL